MSFRNICVMVACLWISACATGLRPGPTATAEPGHGLLVVSITHKAVDGGQWLKGIHRACFSYTWDGGKGCLSSSNEFGAPRTGVDMSNGRLNVVSLAPGTYQVTGWTYGADGVSYSSRNMIPLVFSVEPGKVTYIGELHLEPGYGPGLFGMQELRSVTLGCSDQSERDLVQFRQHYPAISSWLVRNTTFKC